MTKYCLGLPFLETRDISPEEARLLQESTVRARKIQNAYRASAWVAPLALLTTAMIATGFSEGIATLLFLGSLFSFAPLFLLAKDAKRRYRLLMRSHTSPTVEVFGVPEEERDVEANEIVRVPATGLILNPKVRGGKVLLTADVEETAQVPPGDQSNALFPRLRLPAVSEESAFRRRLTGEEQNELKKIARTRGARLSIWTLLAMLYMGFGVVATVLHPSTLNTVRAVMYLSLLILVAIGLRDNFRLVRRFKRDVKEGYVVQIESHEVTIEVLPNTGYYWTVGGNPAPDRRIGVSARRI